MGAIEDIPHEMSFLERFFKSERVCLAAGEV